MSLEDCGGGAPLPASEPQQCKDRRQIVNTKEFARLRESGQRVPEAPGAFLPGTLRNPELKPLRIDSQEFRAQAFQPFGVKAVPNRADIMPRDRLRRNTPFQ